MCGASTKCQIITQHVKVYKINECVRDRSRLTGTMQNNSKGKFQEKFCCYPARGVTRNIVQIHSHSLRWNHIVPCSKLLIEETPTLQILISLEAVPFIEIFAMAKKQHPLNFVHLHFIHNNCVVSQLPSFLNTLHSERSDSGISTYAYTQQQHRATTAAAT